MRQTSVYVLIDSRGHELAYNPSEGLIFFRGTVNGAALSERLGIATSDHVSSAPGRVFSLNEMREHYRARLKEGFKPGAKVEVHFIAEISQARSLLSPQESLGATSGMAENFVYGLTDS